MKTEIDFLLLDIAKDFEKITSICTINDIFTSWESNDTIIGKEIDFDYPRPMFRSSLLYDIFALIDSKGTTQRMLKSTYNSMIKVFENLPYEENAEKQVYQNALRIMEMYRELYLMKCPESTIKPFFLRSRKYLVDCTKYLDDQDREKRKSLPHVTFPDDTFQERIKKRAVVTPVKKPSLAERRNFSKTPIKTRRIDIGTALFNDSIVSRPILSPPIIARVSPPHSPYMQGNSLSSPLHVGKKSNVRSPFTRRSWAK